MRLLPGRSCVTMSRNITALNCAKVGRSSAVSRVTDNSCQLKQAPPSITQSQTQLSIPDNSPLIRPPPILRPILTSSYVNLVDVAMR